VSEKLFGLTEEHSKNKETVEIELCHPLVEKRKKVRGLMIKEKG